MERERVLALLRERTRRNDVVDLVARRHPDIDPPGELVPRAIEAMVSADAVGARIPYLSETCRDFLRLRLQGKSSEEIAEELDVNPAEVYARCRRGLFPSSKPLPSTLEGPALFARALEDQRTFNSLRDDHTLAVLLEDPAARAQLLAATEEVRFTLTGTLGHWFERPRSKVLVALGLTALVSIAVQQCGR